MNYLSKYFMSNIHLQGDNIALSGLKEEWKYKIYLYGGGGEYGRQEIAIQLAMIGT